MSLISNYTQNINIRRGDKSQITEKLTQNQSRNNLADKTYFFTGTAERVLTWSRIFNHKCYFEVIASLVSVQESQDNLCNIILLKDKKGPILQLIHYWEHELLEEQFIIGQMLRCVGYMTGINTMIAISIKKATSEELTTLKRYCYIGDFTISGLINAEENR